MNWIEILNKYDLLGLRRMGAPTDEYVVEAKVLEKAAINCQSKDELANLLKQTFKNGWFTLASDDVEDYRLAAEQLWPIICAENSKEK